MDDQRKTDLEAYTRFRACRFIKDGGKWYFCTREGTTEGPFEFKTDAEERLVCYIKIMASGFMPSDSKLSIQPINVPIP